MNRHTASSCLLSRSPCETIPYRNIHFLIQGRMPMKELFNGNEIELTAKELGHSRLISANTFSHFLLSKFVEIHQAMEIDHQFCLDGQFFGIREADVSKNIARTNGSFDITHLITPSPLPYPFGEPL